MSKAEQKILDGLKDAVEGNLGRVHIPADGGLQTWVRIDPKEEKVIPRSQYEALMEAAKVFAGYMRFGPWGDDAHCALASLRSAGIEIEDKTP